jgi:tRNA/rRNA methyltransferase
MRHRRDHPDLHRPRRMARHSAAHAGARRQHMTRSFGLQTDDNPLAALRVVLVRPRFPENIGMAARACANMGVERMTLVAPERWDIGKARPLATPQAENLLARIQVTATLAEALADATLVVGTTTRAGGWRREMLGPEQAAQALATACAEGEAAALVFGPEDRGLSNEEIALCRQVVRIPATSDSPSLNLAQAVLLMLYECRKARDARHVPEDAPGSRRATHAEQELLFQNVREVLLRIDFAHGDNPEYFLMPLRRFLGRAGLRRHEYDMLMGICRQLRAMIGK